MAFGVKVKTIKTNQSYTIEGFYEAIKDKQFSAGVPALVKHGLATIIAFPALDRQNQVQILLCSMGKEGQKFSIQKSQEAGLGNMAGNMVLDSITKGVFGWGSIVGNTVKRCEELVELTTKELNEMGL